MDAVILAAGRGERLNGIAVPYGKPLLPVNGKPLIRNAVELADQFADSNPIVVVAPENALPISQVLDQVPAELIVQRHAWGPGHALARGLRLVESEFVLVLMADNVLSYDDVRTVSLCVTAAGIRRVQPEDAERFTRLRWNGAWVEKVPVESDDVDPNLGTVRCWVGPLKLHVETTIRALNDGAIGAAINDQIPIGPPVLNAHMNREIGENRYDHLQLVDVDTFDIGVPEWWNGGHGG